ncbi:MAG: polysaccharide deacetylase family protein [Caldilineales bacterium]|nr:polysaccharide deacetylase family protein [Caldilineales bacterium]
MFRRYIVPAASAAALAAGMLANQRKWVRRLAAHAGDVLYYVDTPAPMVALTIDDSPHPRLTPHIVQMLAAHQATATFFILGAQVPHNEGLLADIVARGHELGNHLMTDDPSIRLQPAEFAQQLRRTHELLLPYGPSRWFRPGSGWYNRRMLRQAAALGYRCVLGSIYPYDAQLHHPPLLSAYVLNNVFPGGIITLHDGDWRRRQTLTVLEKVLPELRQRGYQVVSLSTLVASAAVG